MGILVTELILDCELLLFLCHPGITYIILSSLYHHFHSGYTVSDGAPVPFGTTTVPTRRD